MTDLARQFALWPEELVFHPDDPSEDLGVAF
jgi:hypothetical protein